MPLPPCPPPRSTPVPLQPWPPPPPAPPPLRPLPPPCRCCWVTCSSRSATTPTGWWATTTAACWPWICPWRQLRGRQAPAPWPTAALQRRRVERRQRRLGRRTTASCWQRWQWQGRQQGACRLRLWCPLRHLPLLLALLARAGQLRTRQGDHTLSSRAGRQQRKLRGRLGLGSRQQLQKLQPAAARPRQAGGRSRAPETQPASSRRRRVHDAKPRAPARERARWAGLEAAAGSTCW